MKPLPDDPVDLHSPAMLGFFQGVMRRQMRRGFRAVRVARPGVPDLPEGTPVVVYSNHPSWWDPAFYIVLADQLFPGRIAFGPMEAAALERYRFMRRIGIFGIEPGTVAGAARLLRAAQRILSDPSRMLWMTAEGSFRDPRTPVDLRPGLSRLLARQPGAVAMPMALEYPFWSEKRPEALAAFGTPIPAEEASEARLQSSLQTTVDGLARASMARDPAAFDLVLSGRSGIGGVYDGWSRARARLAGRPYQADHLSEGPR